MHASLGGQPDTTIRMRWSRQGNQAKNRESYAELYLSYDQIKGS
jgi:hypothetical protein